MSAVGWRSNESGGKGRSVLGMWPPAYAFMFEQKGRRRGLVSDDIVFTKAAYDAFVASKTVSTQEVSA